MVDISKILHPRLPSLHIIKRNISTFLMKQQASKAKSASASSKSKATVPKVGNRSTRRAKRKDSEEQCTLPEVIPLNQHQAVITKQSFESETTRFIIQIPLAIFVDEHFQINETTRVQNMPVQVRLTRDMENIICCLKLPDVETISPAQQISLTLHGKYSWFNGSAVVNKPIKSVRKTLQKQSWEEAIRLKFTGPAHSDFFVVLTLRAEEQLCLDYPGLVNQGNTCYLNSYLQMFFHLPEFRKLIFLSQTKQTDKFPATLQMLFYRMQIEEKAVSPEELIKSFGWSKKDMQVQQDVQEFSCLFFEILERKVIVNQPLGRIQSIPTLFCGELSNYIECINVEFRAENFERFYDLSIPMAATLNQSLSMFFEETILDEGNRYQTDLYGLQQARKGLRISKLPPVLMLQLKRFQYNYLTESNQKILSECKYPEQIDFAEWTLHPETPQLYVLYAVLVHEGSSASSGHYYVLTKIQDQWFRFNDQRVERASRERALQYNYGGESTTIEYDPRQMRVDVKGLTLTATAYMLVYIKKQLQSELFQNQQIQIPQWLLDQAKQKQELQAEKKLRKLSICDVPMTRWSKHYKGQKVQSMGICPKDRDEIAQKIESIPKSQKVWDWIRQLVRHDESEDKYVYLYWVVQQREVLIHANCRASQSVKTLFSEVQDPLIIRAPIAIGRDEYLVVIKLYKSDQQTPFVYYRLTQIKKECQMKDLYFHLLLIFQFQEQEFHSQYYLEDKKTGVIRIQPTDTKMIPQISPAKNQLLVVVVEHVEKEEQIGEVERWYKAELDSLLITFKDEANKQQSWQRQLDNNTTVKDIREIIYEEFLQNSTEYQSSRNIVVKYKAKKNSKLLSEAKDSDKLKEIIKCEKVLFFSFSSLSVNQRLTQRELVFYLRLNDTRKLSEPQTIVIGKSKNENVLEMICKSEAVRTAIPAKMSHSYRFFLLAKDKSYINDIVDEEGFVAGKGELLAILEREKNTALVVEQYEVAESKVQSITVLVHHVTKTGERFGNPLWHYTQEDTLLSALKNEILELVSQQQVDFQGKKHQINPSKVRLLAYVKQWSKAEDLPELIEKQGETELDESVGSKFGHPRYLRVGIVHNAISKSVQKLNLNVQ